jgi:hippurate hydrolase
MIMAGTDQIDVIFHGKGGHGSLPQLCKDPVVMLAMAVAQWQMIVSRVINPAEMAVLTVGAIRAGTDNNVIPEMALAKLNLRYFDLGVREKMVQGVRDISNGIAATYNMPADQMPTIVMKGHSPPLVNDPGLIKRLTGVLDNWFGADNVASEFPPATGSEDAHLLVRDFPRVPIGYMSMGVANPQLSAAAWEKDRSMPFVPHGPHFRVDLDSVPLGAKVAASSVLALLAV